MRKREIPVNLPDIPVPMPSLQVRCRTHAENMQGEGWYTTANALSEAADVVEETPEEVLKIIDDSTAWDLSLDSIGMRQHIKDLLTGYFASEYTRRE